MFTPVTRYGILNNLIALVIWPFVTIIALLTAAFILRAFFRLGVGGPKVQKYVRGLLRLPADEAERAPAIQPQPDHSSPARPEEH